MESSHEYEMLKMSLDTKIADMKARLRDATAQRQRNEEAKAEAAEEMAAVEKAKDILTSGVKVFLQVRKHLPRDDPQRRLEAKQDPFAKVRDLIESMIDKLMKAAAEEAEAKAFCDTEMAKSKARQKKLTSTADMHAVRIEKAEARKAKLNQAIKILETEVSEIDKSQEEGTKLRHEENAKFLKASADYEQSADAA